MGIPARAGRSMPHPASGPASDEARAQSAESRVERCENSSRPSPASSVAKARSLSADRAHMHTIVRLGVCVDFYSLILKRSGFFSGRVLGGQRGEGGENWRWPPGGVSPTGVIK